MIPVPPLIPSSQNFNSTFVNNNLDVYGKLTFQTGSCVGLIITNDPVDDFNAVNKLYVDTHSGGGGTPSAPIGSIQFNDNNSFGGSSMLTWTSNVLNVNGITFSSSSLISVITSDVFYIKTMDTSSDSLSIFMSSGNSSTGTSGNIDVKTGDGVVSGQINIKTGDTPGESSGNINISTGSTFDDQVSGNINISTGNNSVKGNINLRSLNLNTTANLYHDGKITIPNINLTSATSQSTTSSTGSLSADMSTLNPGDSYSNTVNNSFIRNFSETIGPITRTYKSSVFFSLISPIGGGGIPVIYVTALTDENSFEYTISNVHPTNPINGDLTYNYVIITSLIELGINE